MAVESSLVNSVGEEYQVWKRGRSYQVCVEEYNVEKSYMGSWEEYEFRYRGGDITNLDKKIKIKKLGLGRISSCWELYTTLN